MPPPAHLACHYGVSGGPERARACRGPGGPKTVLCGARTPSHLRNGAFNSPFIRISAGSRHRHLSSSTDALLAFNHPAYPREFAVAWCVKADGEGRTMGTSLVVRARAMTKRLGDVVAHAVASCDEGDGLVTDGGPRNGR